jgi:hypothetical protein
MADILINYFLLDDHHPSWRIACIYIYMCMCYSSPRVMNQWVHHQDQSTNRSIQPTTRLPTARAPPTLLPPTHVRPAFYPVLSVMSTLRWSTPRPRAWLRQHGVDTTHRHIATRSFYVLNKSFCHGALSFFVFHQSFYAFCQSFYYTLQETDKCSSTKNWGIYVGDWGK